MDRRDGLGWEFTSQDGRGSWSVFREDGGPFPVFSAARSSGFHARRDDLAEMTYLAVSDLLTAAGLTDEVGWMTRNLTAALQLATDDAQGWEGEEWALESGREDEPLVWSSEQARRTPYAWLRMRGRVQDAVISGYQDDANFGLSFISTIRPDLSVTSTGSRRPRRDVPLVAGPISCVEVAYDTTVEGSTSAGIVTEALLHGPATTTLLIAAEAYSRTEWHLYDESVVAVSDLAAADSLPWIPERKPWRSTLNTA